MKKVRIGTSGYQYNHWKGVLYAEDLPKSRWFERYCETFDTVELNTTFYHQPKDSTYESWCAAAPPGFKYAVKYSRFGTHIKRLKEARDHVGRFLSGAERLKDSLGPILVQLPPHFRKNKDRLDEFLRAAPRSHQWALEFRDPSWLDGEIFGLLRAHDAALVLHDHIKDHPQVLTADWVYLRFHGGEEQGGYSARQIEETAERIEKLLRKTEMIWVYFNNDVGGHAVRNAMDLATRLQERGVIG